MESPFELIELTYTVDRKSFGETNRQILSQFHQSTHLSL